MNANELADALETMTTGWFDDLTLTQAATMLRQQQAEITNKKLVNDTFADLIKLQGKKIDEQQAEIEALKEPKIPLLEQEIRFILGHGQCWQGEDCSMPNLMYIIRAVEAAHGIGVKQDE
jgi:hypothetical protein